MKLKKNEKRFKNIFFWGVFMSFMCSFISKLFLCFFFHFKFISKLKLNCDIFFLNIFYSDFIIFLFNIIKLFKKRENIVFACFTKKKSAKINCLVYINTFFF